jgi:hypothetical protein
MKNVTPFKIYDYVKGQKISVPGIYRNVPMEVYHSDCCAGPSISSSGIRTIEAKSLLHFFKDWYGNPNRKEPETKAFFSVGKAVHSLSGGEEKFAEQFVVRPDEWADWKTKAARDWRAMQELDGKTVLAPADIDQIRGMVMQLAAHPTIQAGILNGLIEHSIFWFEDITLDGGEVVRVWFKSRPDVIPIDSFMGVDLKTTTDASPLACRRAVTDYGYHIQLGMVHEGLLKVANHRLTDHVLVFIEKTDPWALNHKPIPDVDIEYGRRQLIRASRKFAQALHDNIWHGYEDDEVEGGLMPYARDRLAKEADNKLLPPIPDHVPTQPAIEPDVELV